MCNNKLIYLKKIYNNILTKVSYYFFKFDYHALLLLHCDVAKDLTETFWGPS